MGTLEDTIEFVKNLATTAKYTSSDEQKHPLLSKETRKANKKRSIMLEIIDLETSTVVGTSYRFRNTPDEMMITNPSRTTITQSKGGLWVEDFGLGIREIIIKGNTGFRRMSVQQGSKEKDGRQLMKELSNLYSDYNSRRKKLYDADKDLRNIIMVFHVFMDDIHEIVHPMYFNIKRSKTNPLLYMYDIKFTSLGPYRDYKDIYVDQIMLSINNPIGRLFKIKESFDKSVTEIVSIIVNDSIVKAFLEDGVINNKIGWIYSVGAWLSKRVDKGEILKLEEMAKATAEYMEERITAVQPPITQEIINTDGATIIGDTSKTAQVITVEKIINFCTVDMPKIIEPFTAAGIVGYDSIRHFHQIEACLMSLSNYPELFKETFEDDREDLKNQMEDSGCATTLRT